MVRPAARRAPARGRAPRLCRLAGPQPRAPIGLVRCRAALGTLGARRRAAKAAQAPFAAAVPARRAGGAPRRPFPGLGGWWAACRSHQGEKGWAAAVVSFIRTFVLNFFRNTL